MGSGDLKWGLGTSGGFVGLHWGSRGDFGDVAPRPNRPFVPIESEAQQTGRIGGESHRGEEIPGWSRSVGRGDVLPPHHPERGQLQPQVQRGQVGGRGEGPQNGGGRLGGGPGLCYGGIEVILGWKWGEKGQNWG